MKLRILVFWVSISLLGMAVPAIRPHFLSSASANEQFEVNPCAGSGGNPCAGSGGNPCAGSGGNPCAGSGGNPCAGNPQFAREVEREDLIIYQTEAYFCDKTSYSSPTVVFRSDIGNIPVFQFRESTAPIWYDDNSSYTPARRCREIAARAVEFHEMNLVSHLRVETINNTQALCISREDWDHLELVAENPNAARLVFTFIQPLNSDTIDGIMTRVKGITRSAKPEPVQI